MGASLSISLSHQRAPARTHAHTRTHTRTLAHRYSGHDKDNHAECEHVVLDQCMNARNHTRQYLSPKVVAHTAAINRLLYPLLHSLGVTDIAHGKNVPVRVLQVRRT